MMGREPKPICWPICVLSADLKGESVRALPEVATFFSLWPHHSTSASIITSLSDLDPSVSLL